MKLFPSKLKALCAAVLSVGLAVTGIAAFQAVEIAAPAHAAATAFTCTSDFYQVSNGDMYQYSVATNTYSKMSGSVNVSGLNAIGYNTGDNYIYGIASGKLYQIASDGSHGAAITLTGATAQSTGGDFIGANQLLTASNAGVWTLVNTSTDVVTSYSEAGSTWKAYDFAYNPTNGTGYGLGGTTLYIGKVSGTTVTVTTKTVTGTGAGTSDSWGAAYVDSAGDAYFFDNTTFDLVEISASGLASATPSAVSITQANSLSSPNDGASCPTASSPLAPTVTTGSATSVTTSGATLNGTVATGLPTGSDVPSGGIQICYSTSSTLVNGALSVSPVCAPTSPSTLPLNSAATSVSLPVSGLAAGTTYYFQLQATNTTGLTAFGSVVSLTTSSAPTHTVTFANNGGSGTMAAEVNSSATALTANTFTRTGYNFTGWNTATDGSGTSYSDGASYSFASDTTLYAQWSAIPNSTVTFGANGGTGTMADESANVATALTANAFTRAGYTFSGWNTFTGGGGTGYTDGQTYAFTSNVTLYAQWTAIPNSTVTFSANGGTGSMSAEAHNVPTALTPNSFTRPGYTFSGWNTIAGGGGTGYTDGQTYAFAASTTLYAQWTAIPNSTVTFDANGGSGTMASESANVATTLTANSFTRSGYTFASWNSAVDGSGTTWTDGASYPFTASVTLFAQWTPIPTETVSFDANGGTGSMSDEVENVATALDPNTFTRAGYTFAGWNTAADGSGSGYSDGATYGFTLSTTLFAQWTTIPNSTVSFDGNGGAGTMPDEANNVPTALDPNTFTRAGYMFAGWNTAADGSGSAYLDGDSYPFDADTVLFAQWTAIPDATVSFDAHGGTGSMLDQSANVPTDLTSNAFTRAGFDFASWNTAADGSGTSYSDNALYSFSANAVLYAQWSVAPNKTVIFDDNGGSGTMSNQADNVPANLNPSTLTRAGYSFSGWCTAANGTGTCYADQASFPFDADTTLFAVWTALPTHSVHFDANGGTGSMTDESHNVATELTANSFSRGGYNFAGWNTSADGSGATYSNVATYSFSSDATMFAQWGLIPVLSFDGNGGSGAGGSQSSSGPATIPTTIPVRPGYKFTGWNTAADGSGTTYQPGSVYPFADSGVLYAQWSRIVLGTTGVNPTPGIQLGALLILLGLALMVPMGIAARVRRQRTAA